MKIHVNFGERKIEEIVFFFIRKLPGFPAFLILEMKTPGYLRGLCKTFQVMLPLG